MTQDDRVVAGGASASSSPSITIVGNPSSTSSNTTTTTTTDDHHYHQQSLLFDYVDKEIDEELVCPICFDPFIDPMTHSSCGNTFCSSCIQSIPKCPLCSEVDFKKNCTPCPKMMRNLLDKLKVKCDMCKNTVLRGELKDHREKYCPLHDAYKQVDELKLKLKEQFDSIKLELEEEFNQKNEQLVKIEELLKSKYQTMENELKEAREVFDKTVLAREAFENSNRPIHLNVGGTIITVSLGTFLDNEREPDNLFKKMFSGQHPIYETPSNTFKDSVFFVDCDPVIFKHIMEWLKFGLVPTGLSLDMKNLLVNSSNLFQLNNLSKKLGYVEESNNNIENNFDIDNVVMTTTTTPSPPLENSKTKQIVVPYSTIIQDNIIISCEIILHTNSKSIPQLLYRGSRDGFKAKDFHSRCDNQGPTLTIIKSSEPYNQIFGGFTTQSWKSSNGKYVSDDSAFLFKIDDENSNQLFRKFNIKQDKIDYAIFDYMHYLPSFGGGSDSYISSDCNLNNYSFSLFGHTYELPPPTNNSDDECYEVGSEKAKNYLAGSYNFKVSEIEVFKITTIQSHSLFESAEI